MACEAELHDGKIALKQLSVMKAALKLGLAEHESDSGSVSTRRDAGTILAIKAAEVIFSSPSFMPF